MNVFRWFVLIQLKNIYVFFLFSGGGVEVIFCFLLPWEIVAWVLEIFICNY